MADEQNTKYKDKHGTDIHDGDIFMWRLPAGFQTTETEPFPWFLFADLLDTKPGTLSEDFEETAVVEFRDGSWWLNGLGKNAGYSSHLGGEFPDGSRRCDYGEIISKDGKTLV